MQIIRTANEMTSVLKKHTHIGFVPTMGCLHNGHLSLLNHSIAYNEITVCSIFVNPAQFNDKSDFEKYPNTIESDIQKLRTLNCSYLFLPSVAEIYPSTDTPHFYELGDLASKWEGAFRPGHFQGVCKVMDRLLNIIPADDLWMGQKDFQQCLVVQKLLDIPHRKTIHFHMVRTIRNESGLALSSRNERLSEKGKLNAEALYKCLNSIKQEYHDQDFDYLQNNAVTYLLNHGFDKIEYLAIIQQEPEIVVATAAWIEGVRLIDNINFH